MKQQTSPWIKTPSVMTGGKIHFYIHKTTHTVVVWHRVKCKWVIEPKNKRPIDFGFPTPEKAMKFADTLPVKKA